MGKNCMPVIFKCKSCGNVLFIFERVGQDCFGLPTPLELINRLNGKCPRCGRALAIPDIDDIKILGRTSRYILDQYISKTLHVFK